MSGVTAVSSCARSSPPPGSSRRSSWGRTASSEAGAGSSPGSGSCHIRTGGTSARADVPPPEEARLPLLQATRTKLSPILLLHGGRGAGCARRQPELEATYDGARSRLWRVDDFRVLDAVRGPIVIADGHHRYETALRFHEEEGTAETAHVLAVLVARDDPGLVIFPTHRIARGAVPELNGSFRLTELPAGAAARPTSSPGCRATIRPSSWFGPAAPSSWRATRRDPARSPSSTRPWSTGSGSPISPSPRVPRRRSVRWRPDGRRPHFSSARQPWSRSRRLPCAGETMPQKSTYFFPKLTSGLLFSPFDE